MIKMDRETSTNVVLLVLVLSSVSQLIDEIRCINGCKSALPSTNLTPDTKEASVARLLFHLVCLAALVYLLLKRSKNKSSVSFKLTTAIVLVNAILIAIVAVGTGFGTVSTSIAALYGESPLVPLYVGLGFVISLLVSMFLFKTVNKRN